ncbi:hypothetical protein GCM10022217_00160 [Chryseobacterium ginsenosidimutans]|uniref:hypothetical protein n=1 Tax=Chryseobacterium ginsenosidimutans TaxID=687846 RepID=UPI0031E47321
MKNLLKLTLLFTLLFSFKGKAQLDTLNYLKQFEANKANYIGQPFSKLLQDMTQIQPKTAWVYPIKNKRSMIRNTMFNFCEKKYSFGNAVTLLVTWQNDILTSQAKVLGTQNHYFFTNDERIFYGSKIVGDIMVYRY